MDNESFLRKFASVVNEIESSGEHDEAAQLLHRTFVKTSRMIECSYTDVPFMLVSFIESVYEGIRIAYDEYYDEVVTSKPNMTSDEHKDEATRRLLSTDYARHIEPKIQSEEILPLNDEIAIQIYAFEVIKSNPAALHDYSMFLESVLDKLPESMKTPEDE